MEEPERDRLAALLAALQTEADEEIAEFEAKARLQAQAILEAARADAVRLEREPVELQEPELAAEAARRLAAGRLEADRRVRQAREASFQDALGALREGLASLRAEPSYVRIFAALLAEALAALPSGRRVLVDPRDEDLARATVVALGADLTVEPALETWGGVILDAGDGRVARNTLEERVANAELALRLVLARIASSALDREEA
jgi:vacuolar-type H+-ATPase subunit E/Vma4